MPVEIRLMPRFQLRPAENDSNALELPIIELAPSSKSNFPHISHISCSVRGMPPELAALIQAAYPVVSSGTPIKLSIPQRLRQNYCKLDRALPANVNCTLQVNVEYFDSDATGNPNLSVPNVKAASCSLWTLAVSQQPIAQPQPTVQPRKTPHEFPGWLAIDFGTSNSTVTLFNNRKIAPPQILPKEQEERLCDRLKQWLNSPPAEALPSVSASEWGSFVSEVSKELGVTDPSKLGDVFSPSRNVRLLEAIRLLEISVGNRTEAFRRAASNRLNQIYHEVFRVPPLEWQELIPVELDGTRRTSEISSELQVVSLEHPLKAIVGSLARQSREKAIADADSNSLNAIEWKFHHSPKRYFGQDKSWQFTHEGKDHKIIANDLIQAAWFHLIQLTEECRQRNPDHFSIGPFDKAVVTYPTVAPPGVRRDIEELVKKLGISQVQTAYDEAVSVAIFFLWREFGGNLNIGIESFKTRCRRDGNKWSQNVLILDIGGGTTDIALIRLTLAEKDPFAETNDPNRGAGGRYYVLTPKLLRSSGHPQLGGELITLRIFRLLKAAICDRLLTAVTTGRLKSERLENLLASNDPNIEPFLDKDSQFQSGKLLTCVEENQDGDLARKALNAANKVLPTRWKEPPASSRGANLQTFYTLWSEAEKAKLELGKKPSEDDSSLTFVLSEPKISELLKQSSIDFQIEDPNSLRVELNREQFEQAVTPVIKEAIGIAKGLVASELGSKIKDSTTCDRVDWLILSGKTCNLDLVEREIEQEFSRYDYFVWNKERVTFVPEYTKLATSAGACYAEKLLQYGFNLEDSKELLRLGSNQLDIDVKNLFFGSSS